MKRLQLGVQVAGTEGRTLRIRPAMAGAGVQLGIVGKRGGLLEALCVDLAHVPSLISGIDSVSELAWEQRPRADEAREQLQELLARLDLERNETRCPKGHELSPENSYARGNGAKGCRQCRREGNYWNRRRTLQAAGLPG